MCPQSCLVLVKALQCAQRDETTTRLSWENMTFVIYKPNLKHYLMSSHQSHLQSPPDGDQPDQGQRHLHTRYQLEQHTYTGWITKNPLSQFKLFQRWLSHVFVSKWLRGKRNAEIDPVLIAAAGSCYVIPAGSYSLSKYFHLKCLFLLSGSDCYSNPYRDLAFW